MKPHVSLALGLSISGLSFLPGHALATVKANNTTGLNSGGSWTGGVAATSADVAVFDSTITGALSVNQGGNLTWHSIQLTNPGGAVTINQSTSTLTLNTGGIDMSAATADLTFGGTGFVRMASGNFGVNLNVASGRTLTFNGQFTNQGSTKTATLTGSGNIVFNGSSGSGGAMSFNITGANVAMNNATNNWSSGTVTSGSLTVGHATALGAFTTTVNAADGLKFATGITSATLRNLAGSGNFALTNADTNGVALSLTGDNTSSYTYSGIMNGAGSLTKNGTSNVTLSNTLSFAGGLTMNGGTLTLTGNNSFGGGLTVNAGVVNFGHSNAAAAGAITAANGTTLNVANNTSTHVGGAVTVSGTNANVTLTSSNISNSFGTTFAGTSDQTLTISGSNQVNFNSSTQQLSGFGGTVAVASGATLRFSATSLNNGGSNTTFDLTGGLSTRNNGSLALGAVTGTGNISMGSSGGNNQALNLSIGGKGIDANYSGSINDADAANGKVVNVTKTGAGTQTFSGNSTYTGATTVSAGTLFVNGSLGASAVTANAGTFGGTGTVGGNVTINGANYAAGASAGSMEIAGDLSLGANSTTSIELGGTAFTLNGTEEYDRTKLTGATATLTLGGGTLGLSLINGFTLAANQAFGIFQLEDTAFRNGTFGGLASDGSLVGNFGGLNLFITYSGNFGNSGTIDLTGGNDIVLYTIPEPTAAGLGSIGMLLLLRRRRS